MATIFRQALEVIRTRSTNTTELGTAFKKVVKVFLENGSTQTQQHERIWHYSDWVTGHEGYSGKDIGIDLVAKIRRRYSFCAFQCKCYGAENQIRKRDLYSLVSASLNKDFSRLLLLGLALTLSISNVFAQIFEKSPPKTPWHHVNLWFDCELKSEEFLSLSIEFKVEGDISNSDLIYIAPFSSKINGINFYGGIQTMTGGWEYKYTRKNIKVGRGGIFSRWADDGKTPISLDYAQGDYGTLFESAQYEGSFVSVRRKIDWGNGRYQFEIRKITNQEVNLGYAWYGAFLTDLDSGTTNEVGRLRFDGSSFRLDKSIATFVESYGSNRNPIPNMKLSFFSPKINGEKCNNKSVYVVYPQNNHEPYTRYATVEIEGESIVTLVSKSKIEGTKKDVLMVIKK